MFFFFFFKIGTDLYLFYFGPQPSSWSMPLFPRVCTEFFWHVNGPPMNFLVLLFPQIFVTTPVRPARRSSITSDFLAEENRREKELERILDRRIADLKTNTDFIIQKYSWTFEHAFVVQRKQSPIVLWRSWKMKNQYIELIRIKLLRGGKN